MLIDCDTCTARGAGCGDCVVTVLLGAPPGWQGTDPGVVVELDEVEHRAMRALADGGLVPPLRHRSAPGGSGESPRQTG